MGIYKRIDRRLGGWLPGGYKKPKTPTKEAGKFTVTPGEAKKIGRKLPKSAVIISPTKSPSKTVKSYTSRSSSSSSSSSSRAKPGTVIGRVPIKYIPKPVPKTVRKPLSRTTVKTITSKRYTPGQIIRPRTSTRKSGVTLEIGTAPAYFGKRLPDKPIRAKNIEELEQMTRKYLKDTKLSKKDSLKKKIKVHFSEFGTPVVSSLVGLKQLPSSVKSLINNPKNIKKIPKNFYENLKKETKDVVELAKVSPTRALARVGGEIFVIAAYGKTAKVVGKVGVSATRKINPKFIKVGKSGTIKIKAPKEIFVRKGKEVFLKSRVEKLTIKKPSTIISKLKGQKPGQFKKFQKTKGIIIRKAESVRAESLRKQTKLSGKEVTAVSVQRQKLVGIVKRRRKIKKPIPSEIKLSQTTRKMLKKFDSGKMKNTEIIKLNNRIVKETKKIISPKLFKGTLIERAFFADPRGRFRISRMEGLPRDAKLRDILKGDFTIRPQSKPQILVFSNTKVQKFPKHLSKVTQKLKTGKKLTKLETEQLLKFQLKKSGKFKPIGAVTREPEIVIAPGEIIKKVKTLAYIEVKGVKVPIVQVKIIKPSKITGKLLKRKSLKKLTSKEAKTLKARLKKESGFKSSPVSKPKTKPKAKPITKKPVTKKPKSISRPKTRPIPKRPIKTPIKRKPVTRKRPVIRQKPVLKKRKLIPKVRPISRKRPISKKTVKKSKRKFPIKREKQTIQERTRQATRKRKIKKRVVYVPRRIIRPKPRPRPKPPVRPTPKRPKPRPPVRPRPILRPPVKPRPRLKLDRKRKTQKRKVQSYNTYARPLKKRKDQRQPRLIKVNKVPLNKRQSQNLRNYITDTSLSRTARIKKTKGKPGKTKLKIPSGYSKRTTNKFRTYRIVKGKRKPLPTGKVIERRKRLLDTRQEKKQITLKRRIKQITKPKKKPVKRKTPIKRPVKRKR